MNKKICHTIGWIILLGMGISWIVIGFSNWYLLLLPMAYLAFSISDGSINQLKKIKDIPLFKLVLIGFFFILSVAIVFGLIQLANYFINDLFHLTGAIKTFSIIVAIILSLYPVKFILGTVTYKLVESVEK